MQQQPEVKGDVFVDRLLGWLQVVLALASLGIVLARFRKGVIPSDIVLGVMFLSEVAGGLAIARSNLQFMRLAMWIFVVRLVASFAYMSVIHGDKLERSTLGFAAAGALYCWVRVRALTKTQAT